MKIKVEVDLTDFYQEDESGSFQDQIKQYIAWHTKQEILKDWKEKMTTEFTTYVVSEIEKSKTNFVDDTLKELAVNAKVKKRYSSNEMISIIDYIKEELSRMSFTESYVKNYITAKLSEENNRLEKIAKNFCDDLKKRYDLLFASQIVSKLNENGMLKENVAKLILDK